MPAPVGGEEPCSCQALSLVTSLSSQCCELLPCAAETHLFIICEQKAQKEIDKVNEITRKLFKEKNCSGYLITLIVYMQIMSSNYKRVSGLEQIH
jgi:hypothetical protein